MRKAENEHQIVDQFPDIRLFNERIIWGVFSWTFPARKVRQIKKSVVRDIGNGWQTPSEIARDYLDFYYPKRLRATGAQARAICEHKTAPLFINPGVLQHGVYIDLQAAYFTIMLRYGWNVDYFPGRWIIPGRPPVDFPLAWDKIGRNCLVSAGISSSTNIWTGKKFIRKRTKNLHVNYGLWTLIQDLLHLVASFAVYRCEALYVHTDGYIIPVENRERLTDFIEALGLQWTIKGEGQTHVVSFGNFYCGERHTKYLDPRPGKRYKYLRHIGPEIFQIFTDPKLLKACDVVYRQTLYR